MLNGKVALITGASRGIGKEIALTFAAYGAKVVVNYNGSKEKAEEVVKEIEAMGGEAIAIQCSVADYEACGNMINEAIEKFGKIDILVNNAGITKDNLVMKISEEDFDAVINTNLKGTFNTIKAMYRAFLKQKGGRIINLSSVSGVLGNAGQANYSSSKAGLIGLTKTMAPRREDTIATHSLPEVHNPWRFYQNVAAYLDGKEERIITLSQVSRVMRLMEAIKLSAETKQVINFEE